LGLSSTFCNIINLRLREKWNEISSAAAINLGDEGAGCILSERDKTSKATLGVALYLYS